MAKKVGEKKGRKRKKKGEKEGRGGGAKVAVVSNVSVVECSMSFGKASFLIFKLLLTPLSENLRVTFQF